MYIKKTFTGCYLNFLSNCSLKKKVNLIRTLCHHVHKICSPELPSNEIKQIKLFLNKNGYPQELISKTIHLHLYSLDRIKTIRPENCIVTLKVPFIKAIGGVKPIFLLKFTLAFI